MQWTICNQRWTKPLRAKADFYQVLEKEGRTVTKGLEQYGAYLLAKGNKKKSADTTVFRLSAFLDEIANEPVDNVTPRQAKKIYKSYCEKDTRMGRPPAPDTQLNTLKEARSFFAWLEKQKKWVHRNPFADVEGVGRRRRGKKKLRVEESRAWVDLCLSEGSEKGEAVVVTFLMGFRASETIGLKARDVDDGGRLLWVDDDDDPEGESHLKNEGARRALEVPEVLRPLLVARKAAVKKGPLYPGRTRHWLLYHVRRLSRAVGVKGICTHSLRGTHSTLAKQQGMSPSFVAAALGHSEAVNERHYTAPGTTETQSQRQVTKRIMGRNG